MARTQKCSFITDLPLHSVIMGRPEGSVRVALYPPQFAGNGVTMISSGQIGDCDRRETVLVLSNAEKMCVFFYFECCVGALNCARPLFENLSAIIAF